jgi:hypothetical protein
VPGVPGVPRVTGVSPPSRTNRNERRQRARRAEAIVTVMIVLVAGVYAWTRAGVATVAARTPSGPHPSTVRVTRHAAELAVLSITGGSGPMILVVGRADGPVAISFPQRLTQVVPGMGEAGMESFAQLDGATVRVGVSNTLGVWVRHFAVASAQSIAQAVQKAGGLTMDLGRGFTAHGTTIGPGVVTLTGPEVTAYLTGPQGTAASRWGAFTAALLTEHLQLTPAALVDTDDAAAASRLLAAAHGARPTALPVTSVGGLVQAPDLSAIDTLARTSLGSRVVPVPVLVQNGNGVPGVGAYVATRLIPAGFRVVLSTNAQSFSVQRTAIMALGSEWAGVAKRARRALGVGAVTVSSVPSGVGDVKIIVGKDFK